VLNVLAAFFLMPADSGVTGKNPSDAMPASGLALLSEVDIELKTPPPEEIKSTIMVEQKKIVEKNTIPGQNSSASNALIIGLLKPSLPPSATNDIYCKIVDGISSIDEAKTLKAQLSELKVTNLVISISDRVKHRYWVYIGPYQTEQEAVKMNVKLREKNLRGYVISNAEVKNSVSLGMFSSLENAKKLQSQKNAKGYRAKIWDQSLPLYVVKGEYVIDNILVSKFVISKGYVISDCD
jgi:cell division septation protein DedD